MSISEQLDDAEFLVQNGRYVGALTVLLLAVAASATKTYPEKTPTRRPVSGQKCKLCKRKPSSIMGDRESFTLFLGERLRSILMNNRGLADDGTSGFKVGFQGNQHAVEDILYKHYRCKLVHEGGLPIDAEFVPAHTPDAQGLIIENNGVRAAISCGSKMVLDYGWIDVLSKAVKEAECNGEEFGIKHYRLIPNGDLDEDSFKEDLVRRHSITDARFDALKDVVYELSEKTVAGASDEELGELFYKLTCEGKVRRTSALRTRGVTDDANRLQPKGVAILREIASAYQRVEV